MLEFTNYKSLKLLRFELQYIWNPIFLIIDNLKFCKYMCKISTQILIINLIMAFSYQKQQQQQTHVPLNFTHNIQSLSNFNHPNSVLVDHRFMPRATGNFRLQKNTEKVHNFFFLLNFFFKISLLGLKQIVSF